MGKKLVDRWGIGKSFWRITQLLKLIDNDSPKLVGVPKGHMSAVIQPCTDVNDSRAELPPRAVSIVKVISMCPCEQGNNLLSTEQLPLPSTQRPGNAGHYCIVDMRSNQAAELFNQ